MCICTEAHLRLKNVDIVRTLATIIQEKKKRERKKLLGNDCQLQQEAILGDNKLPKV